MRIVANPYGEPQGGSSIQSLDDSVTGDAPHLPGVDSNPENRDGSLMDPEQIARVQSSFEGMDHAALVEGLYRNLFSIDPDLRALFRDEAGLQARRMADSLSWSIQHLDQPDLLHGLFDELGRTHASYGIRDGDFESLRLAFAATLDEQLAAPQDAETTEAWAATYRTLAEMLKAPMQEALASGPGEYVAGAGSGVDQYLARFLPGNLEMHDPPPGELDQRAVGEILEVEYVGEGTAKASLLQTILQVSLGNKIQHVFECGGRARCSTCRVEILEGLENCRPRTRTESAIASRKGFTSRIRLACQTKVCGPVKLRRLVFDRADIAAVMRDEGRLVGREMKLAVLFSDIRNFTRITERNLPYDVVHMLNRAFNVMGKQVDEHSGYIDKYMGDGMMVLFGLNPARDVHPCHDAVRAAVGIQESISEINEYLSQYFDATIEVGVGVHYGSVIVGEIGFHRKRQLTALGDVVNVASRIESETKAVEANILVSGDVCQHLPAGEFVFGRDLIAELKGKAEALRLVEVLGN